MWTSFESPQNEQSYEIEFEYTNIVFGISNDVVIGDINRPRRKPCIEPTINHSKDENIATDFNHSQKFTFFTRIFSNSTINDFYCCKKGVLDSNSQPIYRRLHICEKLKTLI